MAVEEKLFVRKATGLVREIGFLTAIIITIANTVGLGWQKRVFQFTGAAPLPENQYLAGITPMTMAFIIGGIVILLSVLSVAVLSAAMPRSGGGYVVVSRIVGPFWGFLGAWLEFLSIAWSFGIIAVNVFEGLYFIFGPMAFGLSFTAPGGIAADSFLFLVGLGLVALFTVIAVFGVRLTGILLQVMFFIPAILTFYVFGLLGSANPDTITQGMARLPEWPAAITPADYVAVATDPARGLPTGDLIQNQVAGIGGYWGAVSTAMIGAYFAYIGYAASSFVGGEIKEANRKLPRAIILASLLIMGLYVFISVAGAAAIRGVAQVTIPGVGDYSLLSAWSYLDHNLGVLGPDGGFGLPSLGLWTTTVAGLSASGIGLGGGNILLVFFGVLWIANDIPPFILTASRILFAMSFDRVLPTPLASVNDRFHSPVNAVIVTGIVAVLGCVSESTLFNRGGTLNPGRDDFLHAALSDGGGVIATDLMYAVFFTLFALSLIMLPLRASKKQIFDTAPYKPGGKWGMVGLGVAALGANLYLDWLLLTAPGGSFDLLQIGRAVTNPLIDLWSLWFTMIILPVIGIALYLVHRMRPGVNYSTIFAQIPPE